MFTHKCVKGAVRQYFPRLEVAPQLFGARHLDVLRRLGDAPSGLCGIDVGIMFFVVEKILKCF
jgi:hypothetical protein